MEAMLNELKFDQNGLIPVITQDCRTDEVLMLAYMNREAFEKSVEKGLVHYFSRSRNRLWLKGETSGHYQHIKSMRLDCDGDALLIKVEQVGAACHTGHHSCFYRDFRGEKLNETEEPKETDRQENCAGGADVSILQELYSIIEDRRVHPKEGSYTNYLFEKGLDKILKKVGEESAEVIIASKNKSRDEIRYETADLFYHLFVLLVERDIKLEEIYGELRKRR